VSSYSLIVFDGVNQPAVREVRMDVFPSGKALRRFAARYTPVRECDTVVIASGYNGCGVEEAIQ
jgi:hypothetical protein